MPRRAKLKTIYEIVRAERTFRPAVKLIERFRDKNEVPLQKLIIRTDFEENDFGCYYYDKKKGQCTIYVNPTECMRHEMNGFGRHPDDYSLTGVVVHEFCHFIDDLYKLERKYRKNNFSRKRLCVNVWAKNAVVEELTELLAMFILNPYLLKVLDEERYDWFRSLFIPITPCTKNYFMNQYKKWCPDAKQVMKKKFNLVINETKGIVKVK